MRIAIWPHSMAIGGSQLNAVELAAALGVAGHDTVVIGPPGALTQRCAELAVPFIEVPANRMRPSPNQVRFVRRLILSRGLDVVHGFEWPPALTAALAVRGTPAVAVGTIMSMAVAPFLPKALPLTVGTEQIAAAERTRGRRVHLLEPPVDLAFNHPSAVSSEESEFRRMIGAERDSVLVVSVSRLARALKSEGLLTAIDVLPRLSPKLQLAVVGDGEAREEIEAAARRANAAAARRAVLVVGAMDDPRPAYAAADIVLGLGGSALRAMAFGKPVVVQGERGFWERLDATTVEQFLWTGWYGIGVDSSDGPRRLEAAVAELVEDPAVRAASAAFGHALVQTRFSLQAATASALALYDEARAAGRDDYTARDVLGSLGGYVDHGIRRKIRRRWSGSLEDFNATATIERQARSVEGVSRGAS